MLRILMLLSLTAGLVHAELLDPQINVMNVGKVIDARPTVSHDRKYITLGVDAGSASLVRLDRAEIITFHVLGLQPFSTEAGHVLGGQWSLQQRADQDSTADSRQWQFSVTNGLVSGSFEQDIDGCAVKKFDLKKNKMLLQFAHRQVGPQKRSALTGQLREPEYEYSFIKGYFSEDMQEIHGGLAYNNKAVPVIFKRKPVALSKSVSGEWSCAINIEHRSFDQDLSQKLILTFNNGKLEACSWAAVHDMKCCVVRWTAARRELAMMISYKRAADDRKRSFASINGKFNKTFDQFDACFDTPDYGQAYIQMYKK